MTPTTVRLTVAQAIVTYLPGAGVWWDVAPAEVSTLETTTGLRAEYETDLKSHRWFG